MNTGFGQVQEPFFFFGQKLSDNQSVFINFCIEYFPGTQIFGNQKIQSSCSWFRFLKL